MTKWGQKDAAGGTSLFYDICKRTKRPSVTGIKKLELAESVIDSESRDMLSLKIEDQQSDLGSSDAAQAGYGSKKRSSSKKKSCGTDAKCVEASLRRRSPMSPAFRARQARANAQCGGCLMKAHVKCKTAAAISKKINPILLKVIPPLVLDVWGGRPGKLDFTKAVPPLLDGKVSAAIKEFALAIFDESLHPPLLKILDKVLKGDLRGAQKQWGDDMQRQDKTGVQAVQLFDGVWRYVMRKIGLPPTNMECICRTLLQSIVNRAYKLEVEHYSAERTQWLYSAELLARVTASKNPAEYAAAVHDVVRKAVNDGAAVCERKPSTCGGKPCVGDFDPNTRDCEMGSLGESILVTRRKRDKANTIVCKAVIGTKVSFCSTCCCSQPIRAYVSSSLLVAQPGSNCEGWFMVVDSFGRSVLNLARGVAYTMHQKSTGCTPV